LLVATRVATRVFTRVVTRVVTRVFTNQLQSLQRSLYNAHSTCVYQCRHVFLEQIFFWNQFPDQTYTTNKMQNPHPFDFFLRSYALSIYQ